MDEYENPLHIVTAYISELGMTFAQETVEGKSNEIKAAQNLIKNLNIKDCFVVTDALNCQKETAKLIVEGKGNYLLSVKDNQKTLKEDIQEYFQDEKLQKTAKSKTSVEKNKGRFEKRCAFVTDDIAWLEQKNEWKNLSCIGAIKKEQKTKKGASVEWHYYISNKTLSPEELLDRARKEWAVETLHWHLDVQFDEDTCIVRNKNIQQILNMARKIALNLIKQYKAKSNLKTSLVGISMLCLSSRSRLLQVLGKY